MSEQDVMKLIGKHEIKHKCVSSERQQTKRLKLHQQDQSHISIRCIALTKQQTVGYMYNLFTYLDRNSTRQLITSCYIV